MTWLGKSSYQLSIRDDIFERRPLQRPVQRGNAVPGYHRPPDHNIRPTASAELSSAIPVQSAKDASKLRAAIIWRDAPHWLTGEQTATALGLSTTDFERRVAAGELGLVSKSGSDDRKLYCRDAVRAMILAG